MNLTEFPTKNFQYVPSSRRPFRRYRTFNLFKSVHNSGLFIRTPRRSTTLRYLSLHTSRVFSHLRLSSNLSNDRYQRTPDLQRQYRSKTTWQTQPNGISTRYETLPLFSHRPGCPIEICRLTFEFFSPATLPRVDNRLIRTFAASAGIINAFVDCHYSGMRLMTWLVDVFAPGTWAQLHFCFYTFLMVAC